MEIVEYKSDLPALKPVKERMDINIAGVSPNLPHRNGFVYMLCGSGGSGKSSLLMSMFKSRDYYRCKFHNIIYFCPEASMMSVVDHPFRNHEHVYTELTDSELVNIRNQLEDIKKECILYWTFRGLFHAIKIDGIAEIQGVRREAQWTF